MQVGENGDLEFSDNDNIRNFKTVNGINKDGKSFSLISQSKDGKQCYVIYEKKMKSQDS